MQLRLAILTPGKWQGKEITVPRFPFLIGRDPTCHLRPASSLVSNRHCVLLLEGTKVLMRDLDSTNGTMLNGVSIKSEGEVHTGDRVKVGPLEFSIAIEPGTAVNQATPLPPRKNANHAADDDAIGALLLSLKDGKRATPIELAGDAEEIPTGRTEPDIGGFADAHLREGARAAKGFGRSSRYPVEWENLGYAVAVHFTDQKILEDRRIALIGEQLATLLQEVGRGKLLLNLGAVRAMSSAMVDQLIAFSKQVETAGAQLVVCNIHPSVYPVFHHTRLARVLKICKDEHEALQAFN
jgi:anti-anti-sigma factor